MQSPAFSSSPRARSDKQFSFDDADVAGATSKEPTPTAEEAKDAPKAESGQDLDGLGVTEKQVHGAAWHVFRLLTVQLCEENDLDEAEQYNAIVGSLTTNRATPHTTSASSSVAVEDWLSLLEAQYTPRRSGEDVDRSLDSFGRVFVTLHSELIRVQSVLEQRAEMRSVHSRLLRDATYVSRAQIDLKTGSVHCIRPREYDNTENTTSFTLCLWIRIPEPPAERKILCARVLPQKSQAGTQPETKKSTLVVNPVVALLPDAKIELALTVTGEADTCSLLAVASTQSLSPGEWTHIACVVDDSCIRIFFDAVCVGSKRMSSPNYFPVALQKAASTAASLGSTGSENAREGLSSSTKDSNEGDEAQTNFLHALKRSRVVYYGSTCDLVAAHYADASSLSGAVQGVVATPVWFERALSQQEVATLRESGPDGLLLPTAADCYLYRLVTTLHCAMMTFSGARVLASPRWTSLLLSLLGLADESVQRWILRTLRRLLPLMRLDGLLAPLPLQLNSASVAGAALNVVSSARGAMGVLNFLASMLGRLSWQPLLSAQASDGLSIQRQSRDNTASLSGIECSADTHAQVARLSLLSEIVNLLRLLSQTEHWKPVVSKSFANALQELPRLFFDPVPDTATRAPWAPRWDKNQMRLSHAMTALYVVGGHLNQLCVGARVEFYAAVSFRRAVSDTNLKRRYTVEAGSRGTVTRLSADGSMAWVLLDRDRLLDQAMHTRRHRQRKAQTAPASKEDDPSKRCDKNGELPLHIVSSARIRCVGAPSEFPSRESTESKGSDSGSGTEARSIALDEQLLHTFGIFINQDPVSCLTTFKTTQTTAGARSSVTQTQQLLASTQSAAASSQTGGKGLSLDLHATCPPSLGTTPKQDSAAHQEAQRSGSPGDKDKPPGATKSMAAVQEGQSPVEIVQSAVLFSHLRSHILRSVSVLLNTADSKAVACMFRKKSNTKPSQLHIKDLLKLALNDISTVARSSSPSAATAALATRLASVKGPALLPALETLASRVWGRLHSSGTNAYADIVGQPGSNADADSIPSGAGGTVHCYGGGSLAKPVLRGLSGELQIDQLVRVTGLSNFPTVRLDSIVLAPDSGVWFFEVLLRSDGLMQVGWADSLYCGNSRLGRGVGDHAHSWAFDGFVLGRNHLSFGVAHGM